MKFRFLSLAGMCLALLAGVPATVVGAPKTVLVHYMPWYVSKPFSGSWGWHWTMNHFNPDLTNSSNGRQEIASWYYPLIGPYDSADPAVLEYHVLLMKLAGIDGVIVDWYGMDPYNDYAVNNTRTRALFNYARKAGLKFALCYEDATIQQEINGKFIAAGEATAHAQKTLLYAESNFFNDPAYLRLDGSPVLLNFGPQYFKTSAAWASNFSVLAPGNRPEFFTEDNRLAPASAGAFDWPPMYLSQTNAQSPAERVLASVALGNYLASFGQKSAAWPAFVSSAFPRFHDIYAQAGVQPSYGDLADQGGATFQKTLALAMTNASPFVQIVTWNDYGEGTIVEPTAQYGFRDLGVIQNFRRQFLDPSFVRTTNDLELPLRLYNLRKQYSGANAVLSAEMDRIFTNIVLGDVTAANLELTGMEFNVPVIYDASATNDQLQFSIGGYLAGADVKVQMRPTQPDGRWRTVSLFSVSTNLLIYSTPIPTNNSGTFFGVASMAP